MYETSLIFGFPVKRVVSERAKIALGTAEQYIVSGGKTPSLEAGYESEAEIGYEVLRSFGVPASDIIVEDRAQNTIDNIIFSDKLLGSNVRIGLASSPRHLERIMKIINFLESNNEIQTGRQYQPLKTSEVQSLAYTIGSNIITECALMKRRMGMTKRTNLLKHLANRTLK